MPILGIMASSITASMLGDYESIATVTVGSGGSSSIDFTSIPANYQHLQLRILARENSSSTATDVLKLNFNNDTSTNYTSSHVLFGTGASALSAASATSQTFGVGSNIPQSGETSSSFGAVVIDLLDYASTNKNKTVRALGGYEGNNANGIVILRSFAWMNSANAINSIKLTAPGNFAQHSSFALYGCK